MSAFWILGIVLNVGLTAAAIWWVIRQMRPPQVEPPQPLREGESQPPPGQRSDS